VTTIKSGNHEDFINFCNNKSGVYYLYLWLQDKPDLANIISCDLPDKVFYERSTPFCHPSPTGSIMTHQTLAESVNALAAACMPDPSQVKLTEEK
jgi:hypothetical protein